MVNVSVYCLAVLLLACLANGALVPDETCVRCLCHGRSGCYFLGNCARYSIEKTYWQRAGRPTVLDDDANASNAFDNCMKSDSCVIKTIQEFAKTAPVQDCNCDGVIDCKDFAAIHYHRDNCRSDFPVRYLERLDSCLKARVSNPPDAGWTVTCNDNPPPQ